MPPRNNNSNKDKQEVVTVEVTPVAPETPVEQPEFKPGLKPKREIQITETMIRRDW